MHAFCEALGFGAFATDDAQPVVWLRCISQRAGVAMRIRHASTLVGSVVLIGMMSALPALGQSVQTPSSVESTRTSGVADLKAERDITIQKARDDVQAWQRKLHDFSENTKAETSDARITARKDFNIAWTETEDALHRWETVGTADWESAKTSYDKASLKLAAIWEKIKA
jgi:hypothetical protein